MKYLLDTNICIALLKGGDADLIQKLKLFQPQDFALCSVVKAELVYGARDSQRVNENLLLLEKFFAPFESLAFDDSAVDYYGTTRSILKRLGTPIGANDLFIASIALAKNLTVVTRNRKEFARVPGLRMEMW